MDFEAAFQSTEDETATYVKTTNEYGHEVVERLNDMPQMTLNAERDAQAGVRSQGGFQHKLELSTGTQQRRSKAADSEQIAPPACDALPLTMDSEVMEAARRRRQDAVASNLTGSQPAPVVSSHVDPREDLYHGKNPTMDRRHFQRTNAQRAQLRDTHEWTNIGASEAPLKVQAPQGAVRPVLRRAPLADSWRGQRQGAYEVRAAEGVRQLGADDLSARGVGAVGAAHEGFVAQFAQLVGLRRAQPVASRTAVARNAGPAARAQLAKPADPVRLDAADATAQTVARPRVDPGGLEGAAGGHVAIGDADSALARAAARTSRGYGDAMQSAMATVQTGARDAQLTGRTPVATQAPTELRQARGASAARDGRLVYRAPDPKATQAHLRESRDAQIVRRGDATRREASSYLNPAQLSSLDAALQPGAVARPFSRDAQAGTVGPHAALDAHSAAPVATRTSTRDEFFQNGAERAETSWAQMALRVTQDTFSRIFNDTRGGSAVTRAEAPDALADRPAAVGAQPRAARDDAVQQRAEALATGLQADAVGYVHDPSTVTSRETQAAMPRYATYATAAADPGVWTPRTIRGM